jgi:hypothetical protein
VHDAVHETQWFDLLIQTQYQTDFLFWIEGVVGWLRLFVELVLGFVTQI